MRIAMIGHKQVPSREGGVEVVVTELATRMAALGHDVTCYSRRRAEDTADEFDYQGVHIKNVPTLNIKGLAALTSSYAATKAALADRPDVIHFHAEGPCAIIPQAKDASVRTIATIHGLDWQRAKWGKIASTYIKRGERAAAKEADEVIVLSKNMQQYFKDTYGRDTNFIPNGIDKKESLPAHIIQDKWGLEKDSYILFLGRIVPEKGLRYLIEAYKKLDTNKRLVIAGASSDTESYYQEMQDLAQDDKRILFTSFVEGDTLAELYSNAYLYVLPSDVEGMPMSLLEAMAYERCCLTSDIPECTEVIRDCGVTFKQGNIDDLAMQLSRLFSDPQQVEELGQKAAERVATEYSWDDTVQQTLELYQKQE